MFPFKIWSFFFVIQSAYIEHDVPEFQSLSWHTNELLISIPAWYFTYNTMCLHNQNDSYK